MNRRSFVRWLGLAPLAAGAVPLSALARAAVAAPPAPLIVTGKMIAGAPITGAHIVARSICAEQIRAEHIGAARIPVSKLKIGSPSIFEEGIRIGGDALARAVKAA